VIVFDCGSFLSINLVNFVGIKLVKRYVDGNVVNGHIHSLANKKIFILILLRSFYVRNFIKY